MTIFGNIYIYMHIWSASYYSGGGVVWTNYHGATCCFWSGGEGLVHILAVFIAAKAWRVKAGEPRGGVWLTFAHSPTYYSRGGVMWRFHNAKHVVLGWEGPVANFRCLKKKH